jgi:hypothetical protein
MSRRPLDTIMSGRGYGTTGSALEAVLVPFEIPAPFALFAVLA